MSGKGKARRDACVPRPWLQRGRRACPSPGTSSVSHTGTQNQAGLGSGLIPHCVSVFVCHLGIKFQINLEEEIAVGVGWVDVLVGCVQASSLGKVQVKLVMGCLSTSLQRSRRWQSLALPMLRKLFGNGTETLLHPFSLHPPTTSPFLGGSI